MPFYDLAAKYLPSEKNAVVVDIGCGDETYFATSLKLAERYKVYNLDKVRDISKIRPNTHHYVAPNRLPFDDKAVDYIHCSHLIEHLNIQEVYKLLREIDRILKKNGILVVSAPLFSRLFFEHPYHIKIYTPLFFSLSIVDREGTGCEYGDGEIISKNFKVEKVAYRYSQTAVEKEWFSNYFGLELMIKVFLKFIHLLGFKKLRKDAYTIVLRKVYE